MEFVSETGKVWFLNNERKEETMPKHAVKFVIENFHTFLFLIYFWRIASSPFQQILSANNVSTEKTFVLKTRSISNTHFLKKTALVVATL